MTLNYWSRMVAYASSILAAIQICISHYLLTPRVRVSGPCECRAKRDPAVRQVRCCRQAA